ncbi:DUF1266 domain-containing protein [Lachnospiraceae bacterium 62-35]
MAAKEDNKKAEDIISLEAARKSRNSESIEKEKAVEYTVSVPEVMDRIAKAIEEYKKELEVRREKREDSQKRDIDKGEFICLLSGISTCRRMPGIPQHMGYRGLYQCQSAEDVKAAREHLEEVFNIHDEDSMKETLWGICVNHDYRQFESFWEGHPAFDTAALKTRGRSAFESAKACAEKLSPIVGKNGFLAWDINEQIGMCRKVYACGLISQERFIELTVPLAKKARQAFHTWEEYAISCLCGAAYFGYRNHDSEENQWSFFELNKNILENLLADDGAWGKNKFKPV